MNARGPAVEQTGRGESSADERPKSERSGSLGAYEQGFFLHIPKTAGRSFGRLLRRETALGDVLRIGIGDEIFPTLASASEYAVVQGHVPYPVAGVLRRPLFILTFVRRPVDRALSLFEYVLRKTDQPLYQRFRDAAVETPEDLVRLGLASNRQTRLIGADFDLAPVLERFKRGDLSAHEARTELQRLTPKPDRETLERAKARLEEIQFVGLTEAFDDSVRLFADVIGMTSTPTAYRINTAPKRERSGRDLRYDEPTLEVVAAANRLDQELYEFAVDLFRRRYERAFGEPPTVAAS